MPRSDKPAGLDSAGDLARKVKILEDEMAVQRAAIERLKQMAVPRPPTRPSALHHPGKQTA